MIISIEGLPCSYKSSVIDAVAHIYKGRVITIPEFVIDKSFKITPELCVINDIAKSSLAKYLEDKYSLVVLDRSYFSTIAYEGAMSKQRYERITRRYEALLHNKILSQPDKIFYLDILPKTSINRAKAISRYSLDYAWFSRPEKAQRIYKDIVIKFKSGDVEFFDTDNLMREEVITMVTKLIGTLL